MDEGSLLDAIGLLTPERPEEFGYIARQLLSCSPPPVLLQSRTVCLHRL